MYNSKTTKLLPGMETSAFKSDISGYSSNSKAHNVKDHLLYSSEQSNFIK
jgi:hypothetical protein